MRVGVVGALLGAVVVLAGCSGAATPLLTSAYNENDPSTWTFEQVVDQAITDARAHGASQAQLDELATAKAKGQLTAEQLRVATDAVRDCLADAGASVSAISERSSLGQMWPSFTYSPPDGVTEEAFNLTYGTCDTQNRAYVTYVYVNQPAAREALGAALSAHQAELKTCLKDMGGRDTDEMTINELWEALKDQSFGGANYGYSQEKDCIIDAGINW